MAYGLHIKRDQPIELEEWRSVVLNNSLLRLDETDSTSTNPRTGGNISIRGQAGGVAVNSGDQWTKVFQWRKGQISFNAPQSTLRNNPVMGIALGLAASLSASIVGDEGEPYDGSF